MECLGHNTIKDLDIIEFGIKTIFFYNDLHIQRDIHTCQFEGLIVAGNEGKIFVFHNNFYGLKQANQKWKRRFNDLLVSYNLEPTSINPCVYVKINYHHVSFIQYS
jgi:hypothetical protein